MLLLKPTNMSCKSKFCQGSIKEEKKGLSTTEMLDKTIAESHYLDVVNSAHYRAQKDPRTFKKFLCMPAEKCDGSNIVAQGA